MVAHGENLWVLNQPTCSSEHSRVSRVDARSGRQVQSSELGEWGQALTAFGRQIWVAHARGVALTAVDEDSLRAIPVEVRGASLWSVTANASNVYAGGRIDGTRDDGLVVMIDPATRREVARARVSQLVTSLVGDDENVVAIGDKGTIWVLSAQNLALRRTITLSTGAFSPRAMKIVRDNLLISASTFRGENGAVFVLRNWWPAVAAVPQNSAPNRVADPSFDCATARSAAEQMICANSRLAALDRVLNDGYKIALSNITSPAVGGTVADVLAFKREQRAWLQTRDACRGDEDLLVFQLPNAVESSSISSMNLNNRAAPRECPDAVDAAAFADGRRAAWYSIQHVADHAVGELGLEPGRLRRHDGACIGHRHQVVHLRRV